MRRLGAAAILLCALAASGEAPAQSSSSGKPEILVAEEGGFKITGWRSRRGSDEITFFDCEAAHCKPGSKVSYRLYAPGPPRTLASFREDQERVANLLQERMGPGAKIEVLEVQGDDRTEPPRFLRAVRVQSRADGSREFVTSGIVSGKAAEASVISTAPDRDTSFVNYAQFLIPIAMIVQGQLKPFPPEKK